MTEAFYANRWLSGVQVIRPYGDPIEGERDMGVSIRSRKQWGADDVDIKQVSPSRRTEFFVHYDGKYHITHLGDAIMKRLERIHKGNKWKTVGYNFVVDQQGNAYEGRGWNGVGAHCPKHNVSGIGVQVAIGGDQVPSEAALATVRALYNEACERSQRQLKKLGHRDGKATECPGTLLYNWVKQGFPAGAGGGTPPVLPKVSAAKSTAELVNEVLAGSHGSGDQRKKSLGKRYDEVQAAVNARLSRKAAVPSPPNRSIAHLANEVMNGRHGTGDARKKSLGSQYAAVQAEVNRRLGHRPSAGPSLDALADAVIRGEYGTGAERRRRLGGKYNAVQALVNRKLR